MNSNADLEQATHTCLQCDQHLDEIARLRDELAQLRKESWLKPTVKRSTLAAVGTFLLAFASNVPLITFVLFGKVDADTQWLFYALWGIAIGAPWAQWSFVGIFCMLCDRPLGQRVLMYLALGTLMAAMTFVCSVVIDADDRDTLHVGYAAPFLSIVMVAPVFVARLLRRWVIARRESEVAARPVSLSSYFMMMTVIGIALAMMRFFPWRVITRDFTEAIPYLLVFGGPLLAVGCLHLWMLPNVLGSRGVRSVRWSQWSLLGLTMFVGSLSSVGGYATYLTISERRFTNGHWDAVVQLTLLSMSLLISALIVIASGYYWLRLLDYELRTTRGG